MKKSLSILSLTLAAALSFNAQAFDEAMAAKIAPVVAKLDHAGLAKGGCKISADDFLARSAKKEKMTVLDVRTPAEVRMVGVPGALHIPMDQLMNKENLDRLPTEGKIVVLCHSGNRAAGATALLKAVGFSNVTYINGGLIALVTATTPRTLPVE